jgi:transposase
MKEELITLKEVQEELEKNNFFGFTAKRDKEHKNRIEYTFTSIKWNKDSYAIKVLKLGELGKSEKIVIGITYNGNEINGWEDLINSFKQLGKKHKTLKNEH